MLEFLFYFIFLVGVGVNFRELGLMYYSNKFCVLNSTTKSKYFACASLSFALLFLVGYLSTRLTMQVLLDKVYLVGSFWV